MYVFDGEKLTRQIKKKGYTQQQVAARIGVKQPVLSSWCKETYKPKTPHLELLTGVLACSPNTLFSKIN